MKKGMPVYAFDAQGDQWHRGILFHIRDGEWCVVDLDVGGTLFVIDSMIRTEEEHALMLLTV